MIVYLATPIFVMIVFGFNDVPGRVNAKWYGFTTQWYAQLFDNAELTSAFKNSIVITMIASAASTLISALLGLWLGRPRFRGLGVHKLTGLPHDHPSPRSSRLVTAVDVHERVHVPAQG